MTAPVEPIPIDPGPAVPTSADPEATFDAMFEAFLAWQKNTLQPGANALAAATYTNAVAASEQALVAGLQAAAASDSAAEANASALAASGSADLAGQQAAQAEQAVERYQGTAAIDPATGKAGPLAAGDWYINTATGFVRAYNGSAWVQGISVVAGVSSLNGLTGALTGFATLTGEETLTQKAMKDSGYAYYNSGSTSALDYTNGSHQRWAPSGTVSLTVANWPASGTTGELLIEGVNLGAATITWPTINWIKSDGTTTTTFASNGVTLQSSGTDWVILWTRDGGTTIYGKVVR